MVEVSLGSSLPKDPPRCEASGFLEPADQEIRKNRKNVFDEYFLCPKMLSGNDGYYNLNTLASPKRTLVIPNGLTCDWSKSLISANHKNQNKTACMQ